MKKALLGWSKGEAGCASVQCFGLGKHKLKNKLIAWASKIQTQRKGVWDRFFFLLQTQTHARCP